MEIIVLFVSGLTSVGLLIYGIHGGIALFRFVQARRRRPPVSVHRSTEFVDPPVLTTQVPLRNDGPAAEQVIRAAAAMAYPARRHEIQVLDDSTDDTRTTVDRTARELRHAGHRVVVLRRRDRNGGRTGALAHGLRCAAGELVAVMDSQLMPPRDFLLKVVPYFRADERLGLVQAAARHTDGKSAAMSESPVETAGDTPAAAPRAETWMGIPGNCCRCATVWRRDAIDAAGGWQADTLAEELDLSHRVRACGWRVRHLTDTGVRTEPPASVAECQVAQVRWAKGSIQTACKLLPRLWRSRSGMRAKLGATLHLTEPFAYPLMLVGVLLAVPAAATVGLLPAAGRPLFIALLVAALFAPHALYLATQRLLYPQWWRRIASFPALVCVGVGVAVANSRAVFEALTGRGGMVESRPRERDRGTRACRAPSPLIAWIEVSVGAYCAVSLGLYLSTGRTVLSPLLFAYAVGFLVTGVLGLHEAYDERAARLRRILRDPRRALPDVRVRGIRARPAG